MAIPVSVALAAADGMFTQTQATGSVIKLGPALLRSSFPLDPTTWQVVGNGWTSDIDRVSMDNTDGGNYYLWTVYPINQTVAGPVTFRLLASGQNIAPGGSEQWGIQLYLTDQSGNTTYGKMDVDFPSGSFTEDQFTATVSPFLPVPAAPTLVASASGGSIGTETVYVVVTALNANGETIASQEANVAVTGPSGSVAVTITAVTGATSYNVYAGTVSGTEYVSGNTTSTSYTVTAVPTSGNTPPVTNTAAQPAYYAYAYIFARYRTGQVTLRDAELFPDDGSSGCYFGKWRSPTIDLWKQANQVITGTGLTLGQVGFYYGDISNVDNSYSLQHSIDVLSKFPILVTSEPGQLTTTNQQYVMQQLVQAGVKMYGYQNVGVPETALNDCTPSIATIEAAIDRCASYGYTGIFFDGFGPPGANMAEANVIIDYAHAKGLSVFANSYPSDSLNPVVDTTTLSNPNFAPSVSPVTSGTSTLPPGTYDVGYTLTTYGGETQISPLASVTVASGQGISLSKIGTGSYPNIGQFYVLSVNLYMSDGPGSSTYRLLSSGYGLAETIDAIPASTAPQAPTQNTAYIKNPTGIICHFTKGDFCLRESFFSRSDNKYEGQAYNGFNNIFPAYKQDAELAMQHGVNFCALAYALTSLASNDFTDWINAYVLAAGLGFTHLSYKAISDDSIPWVTPPTFPPLGSKLVTQMQQVSNTTYEAITDAGAVQFITPDNLTQYSHETYASQAPYDVTVTAGPSADTSLASNTTYGSSADGNTWTTTDPAAVPDRYFREVIEVHN